MATAKKTAPPKTGTAVAVKKASSGNVVSIQEQLKAQAAALANRTQPSTGSQIKLTKDKKFQLPNGQKVEGPLELVVVDFVSRNKFYDRAFDSNNPIPPACYAIHAEPKQMAPSDSVPEKQSDDCTSCPLNQFKSAANGKGKACKNSRYLAVLPPDATEDEELWFLEVSPTGLKSFDGFVNSTMRTFQMPPISVVVDVSFDENAEHQTLIFGNVRPNENLAVHYPRQKEAMDTLMQDIDTSSYQPMQAPPARQPVRKAVAGARR